ncbi:MAG: CoA transferase [SAR202 cluster bacterium]|nr:CoA transferase [SAR202 cluster bacterium]
MTDAPTHATPDAPGDGHRQALAGLKVLDFCWVVIGPMLTRTLADHGATVIRVESKSRMETLRISQPFAGGVPGVNRSGYFANYNANKLGLALNMANPGAIDIVKRLAQWANVVTENFTPGTMERWGIGHETLLAANPALITFSASMFGDGGPQARQPGYGPVLTSLAGFSHLTGYPWRPPSTPYGAYTDFLLPHFGVAAIIGALDQRRRTGRGTHIELSQLEASLHYLAPALLDYQVNGRILAREANADPGMAPHGVYPCAGDDRWCAIACEDDAQWRALCDLMGKPSLADDPRFVRLTDRKRDEAALDAIVAAWTRDLDAGDVAARCLAAGIAAGVAHTTAGLFDDPQLKHRRHFAWVDHPEIGRHAVDTDAFALALTPARHERPAPLLGQYTRRVCQDVLGLSEEEIDALLAQGVLE